MRRVIDLAEAVKVRKKLELVMLDAGSQTTLEWHRT